MMINLPLHFYILCFCFSLSLFPSFFACLCSLGCLFSSNVLQPPLHLFPRRFSVALGCLSLWQQWQWCFYFSDGTGFSSSPPLLQFTTFFCLPPIFVYFIFLYFSSFSRWHWIVTNAFSYGWSNKSNVSVAATSCPNNEWLFTYSLSVDLNDW